MATPFGPAAPQETFYVDDLCTLKENPKAMGVIDRTVAEIDTHGASPQSHYDIPISRHSYVPNKQFQAFLANGRPPPGTVLIVWYTGPGVQLIPETLLQLVDRGALMVGDIVKKQPHDAMSGTVIGLEVFCDLEPEGSSKPLSPVEFASRYPENRVPTDGRLLHIPAEELSALPVFQRDDMVLYKNTWVGRVQKVADDITVRLSNNSVVTLADSDNLETFSVSAHRMEVGDIIRTKKWNLRRGIWRYGVFDPNIEPMGDVIEVHLRFVDVEWLCARIGEPSEFWDGPKPLPPPRIESDDIAAGNMIVHDNSRRLREGSKRFALKQNNNFVIEQPVRFEDLSAACIKYDGTHSVTKSDGSSHINHIRRIPRTSTLGYDVNVFSVCNTDTRVTIRWQDASITTHSSTEVIPDLDVDNEVELFPGDIVIPTPSGVNGIVDRTSWRPSKIGVVQSVTASERLAQVLWQPAADVEYVQDSVSGTSWVKGGSFTGFPVRSSPDGPGILEDVTIYSVVPAPNLDRKIGDFVLTSIGLWGAADFGRFGLVGEFAPNPKTDWFGEVIDITLDGLLVLRIVTDDDSEAREVRIAPELTIVALSVTDAVSETDSDYDSGNGSHSTNPGEMWVENDDGERVAYTQGEDADWATEASDDNNPPSSLPPPHQGETTQDSQQAAVSNSPDGTASSSSDGTASSSPDCTASSSSDGTASSSPGGTVSRSPLKAAARIVGGADAMHVDSSPTAAAARPIPRPASFEVLDGAPSSNHRFVSSAPCEHSSQFLRRIQKEHGILASSLPEGVFVRTWESRLDLLRALIVGPADTPYEFAPFVIDIRLPPGYPNLPPQAFFYSHTDGSGPINPNLYEDGKICLSLLNTWHADAKNESWSAGRSTLLQLFVSLLGLVLVKEPFFNEAGYDVRVGSAESAFPSAFYSERVYFRTREFILEALTNCIPVLREGRPTKVLEGFYDVVRWLYVSGEDGAPKLLDQAVRIAKEMVSDAENGVALTNRALPSISKGAVIMLKAKLMDMENALAVVELERGLIEA